MAFMNDIYESFNHYITYVTHTHQTPFLGHQDHNLT